MKQMIVLLGLALLSLLIVPLAKADFVTYPAGCYVCKERSTWIGYYEDCTQVNSGERGDGIYCKEMDSLLIRYCQVSGGICEYIVVDGGGTGSGGSGGGGDTCGATFGYCPAECFTCGAELY